MLTLIMFLVAAVSAMGTAGYAATDSAAGVAACHEIEDYMNVLLDSVKTRCFPAASRSTKGAAFKLVAQDAVFALPKGKKAWLVAAVGAVGKVARDRPGARCEELWVTDSDLDSKGRAYLLSCSTVKTLQKQLYDGGVTVDSAYQQVLGSLREIPIPVERSPRAPNSHEATCLALGELTRTVIAARDRGMPRAKAYATVEAATDKTVRIVARQIVDTVYDCPTCSPDMLQGSVLGFCKASLQGK